MAEVRHIAIYIPSLRGGGAERVMVTLANAFADRGHRVDLVLVKAEGPYLAEVDKRVNVIDLDCERALASIRPLVRYFRRQRPSAMLSALPHANLVAIIARALARTNTRLVISERNTLRDRRTAGLFRYMMRILYPYADAVVAVSKGIANELITELGLPQQRVTAIPNPVNIGQIAVLSAERPSHPWLTAGSPPLILAVGRLEPQKDYPTLLEAFARLRARRDVRLVILGDGSLRADLDQRIVEANLNDSVLLAGFQPNPFGWMAASSVYVLSSRNEGFPNSLIQAMASGVRVVSTNCPTGPDEILEGGKWGRLVPVGDVDALAKALGDGIDDPSQPDTGARLQDFRQDKVVTQYEEMLK